MVIRSTMKLVKQQKNRAVLNGYIRKKCENLEEKSKKLMFI